MPQEPRRATIYFDPEVHGTLRLKSVAMDRSVSDLVNEAVKRSLSEDAEDLTAFEERAREASLAFDEVVKALRRRGKL
jgi:hypothetical protein